MTRTIRTITIFILIASSQIVYGQKNEEKLVRKSFENYKSAILNDQGESAVTCVDSRTIKYYNDISELVKTADSTKIETLSILDKLMVLMIRLKATKEEMLNFDGKSLLMYAIKGGMVGKNGVMDKEIGDVEIETNFAKGQLISNGKKTPIYFHFYKENEQWRIDLTSIFPMTSVGFKKLVEDSG